METIFALATASGKAGVAVIRISGRDAKKVFAVFNVKEAAPRLASLASLHFPGSKEIIDKALILYFKAPNSFTGEDVVELHLHGSRAVIRAVYEVLGKEKSFRLAEAGEFTRRAFLNGKMDLTETEGLADLIEAETIMQQKQAMRQMTGALSKIYEGWRAEIIHASANLEAYIDFPDEDLPKDVEENMLLSVKRLLSSITDHLSDNKSGEILREGVYCTIIGAPNAGKSSLLNFLAGRDVAIVSEIAGTTRDVLEVKLDIAGFPVIMADTAGLRESSDSIEMEGVKRALERAKNADLKIAIFDGAAKELDKKTLDLIDENTIILLSKSDLSEDRTSEPAMSPRSGTPLNLQEANSGSIKNNKSASLRKRAGSIIKISTKTSAGFPEFFAVMEKILAEKLTPSSDPKITRARHRSELLKAKNYLEEFIEGRRNNIDIELSSEELRLAARSIGRITGKIDVEDILDELFRNFCIGK